jgi:2-heptyl-1-hydroxyquinolin-4(1H)-one methyltransferase
MVELPDFDAVYQGEPTVPGLDEVPWNIGEPQPSIAEVIRSGRVSSPVLDAGCGVGVTSRVLAREGFEVVGLDASPAAVDQARRDAEQDGLDITFDVADLTALSGHDGRFATVIDSAVFHSVEADGRPGYVASLARACRPGAVLHVLVFTADAPMPDADVGVNGVTETQLRELVEPTFTIDTVEPATITALIPERVLSGIERDGAGRALLPALRMTAHLTPAG